MLAIWCHISNPQYLKSAIYHAHCWGVIRHDMNVKDVLVIILKLLPEEQPMHVRVTFGASEIYCMTMYHTGKHGFGSRPRVAIFSLTQMSK